MSTEYDELRAKGPAAFAEETGRQAYWRLLAAERASLRVSPDGPVRPELVEHVACAACGADDPAPIFEKDAFRYVRCPACGTVYVDPQLTEAAMLRFWSTSPVAEAWTEILRHPAQREFDEAKYASALDRLVTEAPPPGPLLDVGCSIGIFLDLARARGYDVFGIEPGESARRTGRELFGLDLAASLDDVDAPPFGVVTSWEVVEHTKRPGELLEALRARTAPDGRLVVLVGGNAASLANRMMRAASAAFDFARYWYFTPSSFEHLLGRTGWEVVRVDQVLDEMDVSMNYLAYGDPYAGPPFAEEVLPATLVDELRRHVLSSGMGYKFLVTARPR